METISAISTPYGIGGIAIVRVSGDEAIAIVERITCPLQNVPGYTVRHAYLHRGKETLDEVLVTVFRAPHSFTGEDVVEIACHGSLYIQQTVLQWLIEEGARLAHPGEFTQRAFLNAKMDLTQAEAVADLIAAQTQAEKDLALKQLRGGVSSELANLRERLLHITSLIELELDFADHEELEFADRSELKALATEIQSKLKALITSFRTGNAIKNGITVAIAGPTNAGKSTLLNALLGEERAIVSNIHGTTRDTIEDTLVIDGVLFRFIDTAGIRETADQIEALGIERSRKAIKKAQIVILVQDLSSHEEPVSWDFVKQNPDTKIIHVWNKTDLVQPSLPNPKQENLLHVCLSAKNGEVDQLKQLLLQAAQEFTQHNGTIISNTRHYEALIRSLDAIERVQQGLENNISGEFLSMDLQDCLNALGEITGQITSQEVLNNIFAKFCIGK